MTRARLLTLTTVALLLEVLFPLVAAHSDDHNDASMDMPGAAPPVSAPDNPVPQSYWTLSDHALLMYWHIALELLAWVVVLPVGTSVSILLTELH